jgi:hypothetical protein
MSNRQLNVFDSSFEEGGALTTHAGVTMVCWEKVFWGVGGDRFYLEASSGFSGLFDAAHLSEMRHTPH